MKNKIAFFAALVVTVLVGGVAYAMPTPMMVLQLISTLTADELQKKITAQFTVAPVLFSPTALDSDAWTEVPTGTDLVAYVADTPPSTANLAGRREILQEFVVANEDNDSDVCIVFVERTSTNCQTQCTASSATCSGATTDGLRVKPSQALTRRVAGNLCICARAEIDNSPAAQFEILVR